jgi:L-asparaginase II
MTELSATSFAPIAATSRSGRDESMHFGAMVGLAADGSIAVAVGDPKVVVFPRSSNKPMQATAMVSHGLSLPPRQLALVCASHDGSPMHTAAAAAILRGAGLGIEQLANTADWPLDAANAREVVRAGGRPTPLQMNCSGKHAGMLATCVRNGWRTDPGYLDVDHPLQQAITTAIDELSGVPHAHVGVDGCGAPAHAMPLIGLARAFRAIATGSAGAAGQAVYEAMTQHPEMVGGETRDVTRLMQAVPGLMAKDGADGVFAAALPDGRALALKVADGSDRARLPTFVAGLIALGVDVDPSLFEVPIMGGGGVVGGVRAMPL